MHPFLLNSRLPASYRDFHSPHQLLHFVVDVQVLLRSLEAVGPLGQAVGQGVAGGRHLPVEGRQPLVTLPPVLIRSARLWGGVVTVARGRGHPGVLGLCGSRGRRGRRRDVVGAVAVGAASVARPSPEFVAMLLVETVQGFQGVQDLMPGHSRASQALQEVDLLYGESWLVCVVRHGFQQAGNEVKYKILQFNSSRRHMESTFKVLVQNFETYTRQLQGSPPNNLSQTPAMNANLTIQQKSLFSLECSNSISDLPCIPHISTNPVVCAHLLLINCCYKDCGCSVIKAAT